MVGNPKSCICRNLGGLGRGGCSCGNMVPFWLIIVTMYFEEGIIVSLICFVSC
jgi:hypothetical protein